MCCGKAAQSLTPITKTDLLLEKVSPSSDRRVLHANPLNMTSARYVSTSGE